MTHFKGFTTQKYASESFFMDASVTIDKLKIIDFVEKPVDPRIFARVR